MSAADLRRGTLEAHCPPVLLEGDTEKDALKEAIAKADLLFRFYGDDLDDGRPFEIRRPPPFRLKH
jgi:hypothetical protein